MAKSSLPANWITYAVSLYLAKDYSRALEVLQTFEKSMKEDKQEKLKKHDRSELTLFEARILEDMGSHAKAVELLNKGNLVANMTAKNEALARIYITIGEKDKALEHLE